ncbi:hypothetical protein V5O48_007611 [Marasmius crinis-equi]|uniref:Uncharacterized protein n=1 Tax=Marasmius crinis-equi TaxID=585013 RepID=A0ABR3FGN7_9AGAR
MPDEGWRNRLNLSRIDEVLNELSHSDILSKLLDGTYVYDFWEPDGPSDDAIAEHIKSLGLLVSESFSHPLMALYRLGSFQADSFLKSRVESIFGRKHTFLLNTSGTGKTRLLFEGLSKNWGLYFTASVDSTGLGMVDLNAIIGFRSDLTAETDFSTPLEITPQSTLENPQQLDVNLQLARKHLSTLLLSRLFFFKSYLNAVALRGASVQDTSTWLKLQLGSLVEECDIYGRYFHNIVRRSIPDHNDIDDAVAGILSEIIPMLDAMGIERIFIVIDEANSAVQTLSGAFGEDDGVFKPIPTLKVLLQAWMYHLQTYPGRFTFVVAGTEIPRDPFSTGDEWNHWVWSSNTGAFDEEVSQKRWAMSMLPPTICNSPDGELFVARLWKWARGRRVFAKSTVHRVTAALMSVIIENKFADLHLYLDSYIHAVTNGYWPYDYDKDDQRPAVYIPYKPVSFDILERDQRLASCMHDVLLSLLFRGKEHPRFAQGDVALVNNTFGRFIDDRCQIIAIDEPFIIAGAAKWFTKSAHSLVDYSYFCSHVMTPSITPRHALHFIALCLAAAFDRDLTSIFTVSHHTKPLQDVSLHLLSFGPDLVDEPLSYSQQLSTNIMTWSSSPEETISWLNNHHTPFCLHSSKTGEMTLMFALRSSSEQRFWVFLRVLLPLSEDEDVVERGRALMDSCHPSSLFQGPLSDAAAKALESLPDLWSAAGTCGVLRVIASFDQTVDFAGLGSDDSSHIAILDMRPIRTSTHSWANNTAIAKDITNSIVKSAVEEWPKPEQGVTKGTETTTVSTPQPSELTEDPGPSRRRPVPSPPSKSDSKRKKTGRKGSPPQPEPKPKDKPAPKPRATRKKKTSDIPVAGLRRSERLKQQKK